VKQEVIEVVDIDDTKNSKGVVESREVTEKRLRDRLEKNDHVRRILRLDTLALSMVIERFRYRADATAELLENFAELTGYCHYCKVPFMNGADDHVIGCMVCQIKVCKMHIGHGFLCNCIEPINPTEKQNELQEAAFNRFESVLNRYGESIGRRKWHKRLHGAQEFYAGFSTRDFAALTDECSESSSEEGREATDKCAPRKMLMLDLKRAIRPHHYKKQQK
jgi:hypothetical protein